MTTEQIIEKIKKIDENIVDITRTLSNMPGMNPEIIHELMKTSSDLYDVGKDIKTLDKKTKYMMDTLANGYLDKVKL